MFEHIAEQLAPTFKRIHGIILIDCICRVFGLVLIQI